MGTKTAIESIVNGENKAKGRKTESKGVAVIIRMSFDNLKDLKDTDSEFLLPALEKILKDAFKDSIVLKDEVFKRVDGKEIARLENQFTLQTVEKEGKKVPKIEAVKAVRIMEKKAVNEVDEADEAPVVEKKAKK